MEKEENLYKTMLITATKDASLRLMLVITFLPEKMSIDEILETFP